MGKRIIISDVDFTTSAIADLPEPVFSIDIVNPVPGTVEQQSPTLQLTAIVTPEGTPVTWTIESGPATITQNGLLTASGNGDIIVKASIPNGLYDVVTVVSSGFADSPEPVFSIAIVKPSPDTVEQQSPTLQLTANVTPEGTPVSWTIEAGPATITQNGLLTAHGNGDIIVKASIPNGLYDVVTIVSSGFIEGTIWGMAPNTMLIAGSETELPNVISPNDSQGTVIQYLGVSISASKPSTASDIYRTKSYTNSGASEKWEDIVPFTDDIYFGIKSKKLEITATASPLYGKKLAIYGTFMFKGCGSDYPGKGTSHANGSLLKIHISDPTGLLLNDNEDGTTSGIIEPGILAGCVNLKEAVINTKKPYYNIALMFSGCRGLERVYLRGDFSEILDINPDNMSGERNNAPFFLCQKLKEIDCTTLSASSLAKIKPFIELTHNIDSDENGLLKVTYAL